MGSSNINGQATVFARRLFAAFAVAVALVPLTDTQAQVTLTEVSRFNLDSIVSATNSDGSLNSRYVGNQVNSVGWNGSRLFVAGFVSTSLGGDFDNQGIIEIAKASPTRVRPFGTGPDGSQVGVFPGVHRRGHTGRCH